VPVSGARDSWFIVHTVKNELGLNPLCVSYNKHYNTRRGHRNLAYLRTVFDVDIHTQVLKPQLVKRVTRETLRLRGSMYWHVLAGQTVWPVQVAVRYRIPLIIWGHHQGLDQVGMFSHLDEVEMTRRYRKDHDLMGLEAEDLAAQSDLTEEELDPFKYPHDKEISEVGVRGIYLGNYIRWDTKAQHEAMIRRFGYESGTQQRTFDTYNDVDCIHYSGLHDWLKYLKWGYGKVLDHATRELRFGRLTRDEAIGLVKKYEQVAPADLGAFLKWLDIDEQTLLAQVDRFRDASVWQREKIGPWRLSHSVAGAAAPANAATVALPRTGDCEFQLTPSKAPKAREDEYVLIDRGYVDGVPA
jgi:N-acetyl sugar amidotransferase